MKNRDSSNRCIVTSLVVALALFASASMTSAVDPPPDGGYRGHNTAEGNGALFSLTTGTDNTAIGFRALFSNTTGIANTAVGLAALASNRTIRGLSGSGNTAVGWAALASNTTGLNNTASGLNALFRNTTGEQNTAIGFDALSDNSIGSRNTAVGSNTLGGDFGFDNTALGWGAGGAFGGVSNTATGSATLNRNASGNFNTANGAAALGKNKGGDNNTAVGFNALSNNVSGGNNIAVGASAGANLTFGFNNIDIGNQGVAGEKRTIRIGTAETHSATFIAGIRGTTPTNMDAVPVVIDSLGQLGTVSSSARFKGDIKPMDKASEAILGLKPVTFHYKSDNTGTPQFGLIAEEVAKVNPDLVVRDATGEIYTVRYDAVNAMLLNEFLKEHRNVEEQRATMAELKSALGTEAAANAQQQKEIKNLTATLKEQASALQKVSDKLEMRNSRPQLAAAER